METDATVHRMLVVDDRPNMRRLLEAAFRDRGYHVNGASNGTEAIGLLEKTPFDVVITDLNMPGKDGMAVLRAAKGASPDTCVIIITGYGTIEAAVEAMRLGAFDFITKPFKLAEIELKVEKALQGRTHDVSAGAPAGAWGLPGPRAMVGSSHATRQLYRMIEKVAPSRSSVLITGPSGTGKELVARAIHEASPRHGKPFVALNCAALAPGILESELFGHEKGAFTGAAGKRIGRFERAHTGTLFLDEVGEIDPGIQTKLLRVLQEGEFERVGGVEPVQVDVRIVAATNRELRDAIAKGQFREDFYYRLNVFSLSVEPLRNRPDDIPDLIDHFLHKHSRETNKDVNAVEDDVMEAFMRYAWPGNVRELENVLERAVVLADGAVVTHEEVPPEIMHARELLETATPAAALDASLIERTDKLESDLIRGALERFRWNKTKAADHLGLKRTTLQYKIKKYGLE